MNIIHVLYIYTYDVCLCAYLLYPQHYSHASSRIDIVSKDSGAISVANLLWRGSCYWKICAVVEDVLAMASSHCQTQRCGGWQVTSQKKCSESWQLSV